MSDVSDKVDALIAEVSAENDVITSAETLLTSINQQLQDALANRGNDPVTAQKIQDVIDQIDAKKSELAAAVANNTPASAPSAPPATEPTT